jgi:hypothetical protein
MILVQTCLLAGRRKAGNGKATSMQNSASNVVEFFAPPSLGFGYGSDSTIYFEVEFRGVSSDPFDMEALKDIHVGIHGTPGHKDAEWTVGWNCEASENR